MESQMKQSSEMMKQSNEMVCRLAERPTTINNSTNSNNHTNHNVVNNVLVDGKSYIEMTDPERVLAIANEEFEPYFLDGLRGVAVFLDKHVMRRDDGSMAVVCTDYARKKIKHHNEKGEIEEDIGACKIARKVAPPIKQVAAQVHDSIKNQLKEEFKQKKIDGLWLDGKTKQADEAYLDITMIDNESKNADFTNKFCALVKV